VRIRSITLIARPFVKLDLTVIYGALCLPSGIMDLGVYNGNKRKILAVWFSGNGVAHINEVTLRRGRLVLGWVIVRKYTILVLFHQPSRPTQPGSVGRHNEYWRWSRPPLVRYGRNGQFCFCVNSRPVTRTASILA